MKSKINLIAAYDPNKVIGNGNSLPWKIKEDLRLFKELTQNNIVIMGRNTFESIGKPLSNRINIVITSSKNIYGVYTFESVESAINYCNKIKLDKKIFIIGGKKIYDYCLSKGFIDKMYISKINKKYEGDIKFPNFDESEWDVEINKSFEEFDLCVYTKK